MRARFVCATVHFEFMADDGENLVPLTITSEDGKHGRPAKVVTSADWEAFCTDGLTDMTAAVQEQLDAQHPDDDTAAMREARQHR